MRYLIFSDTHLDKHFSLQKLEFLKNIINQADKVIINGDFWDGYSFDKFEDFINSPWQELFPLLKSKETVYLYGNHDPKLWSDERVSQFSLEQHQEYELNLSGKIMRFVHGDKFAPAIDIFFPDYVLRTKLVFLLTSIYELFSRIILGNLRIDNKNMKQLKWKSKALPNETILFCGHTHIPDFIEEANYINTGFIRLGRATYAVIEDGRISLKKGVY